MASARLLDYAMSWLFDHNYHSSNMHNKMPHWAFKSIVWTWGQGHKECFLKLPTTHTCLFQVCINLINNIFNEHIASKRQCPQ